MTVAAIAIALLSALVACSSPVPATGSPIHDGGRAATERDTAAADANVEQGGEQDLGQHTDRDRRRAAVRGSLRPDLRVRKPTAISTTDANSRGMAGGRRCKANRDHCNTCSADRTVCTRCRDRHYLYAGRCVARCPPRFAALGRGHRGRLCSGLPPLAATVMAGSIRNGTDAAAVGSEQAVDSSGGAARQSSDGAGYSASQLPTSNFSNIVFRDPDYMTNQSSAFQGTCTFVMQADQSVRFPLPPLSGSGEFVFGRFSPGIEGTLLVEPFQEN